MGGSPTIQRGRADVVQNKKVRLGDRRQYREKRQRLYKTRIYKREGWSKIQVERQRLKQNKKVQRVENRRQYREECSSRGERIGEERRGVEEKEEKKQRRGDGEKGI